MADLNDIKLSSDDILKKQFRTKVKGYDPDEVDAYLDQVISDYETFSSVIEDLYGQIGNLQRELMDSKESGRQTPPVQPTVAEKEEVKTFTPSRQNDLNANDGQGEISTNMAIIQRISTLERKVYNLEQRVYGLQK